MTCAFRSSKEDELLGVAIDLFKRSEDCSATEPSLSHQYTLQAYRLGAYSKRLRRLITGERVKMIVQQERHNSVSETSKRISEVLDAISATNRFRRSTITRAGVTFMILLASAFVASTPLHEASSDEKVAVLAEASATNF